MKQYKHQDHLKETFRWEARIVEAMVSFILPSLKQIKTVPVF